MVVTRTCRLVAADGAQRVIPEHACRVSDLLACMLDADEDESDEENTVEVPLPGIASAAVLDGIGGYLMRVAVAGEEPALCRDSAEGALPDYRLDEMVGAGWGDTFFRECTTGDCASVCALLQAAEYMQMEGLRWLCAAKLACTIRGVNTEVALCGLFDVPLERMDRYAAEVEGVCASMPWLTEDVA